MSALWYPLSACKQNATERRTALAAGDVRLYKSSFLPTPSNVLADYIAAEADYDGYAPIAVANFLLPLLAPGSGWMINQPLVQFEYVDGVTHITNVIGGAFYVDAGAEIRQVLQLAPSEYISFEVDGDGWPITYALLFPTGYVAP